MLYFTHVSDVRSTAGIDNLEFASISNGSVKCFDLDLVDEQGQQMLGYMAIITIVAFYSTLLSTGS